MYFDDEGNLKHSRVFIVYGAPASGKTTYVRQNRQSGDLIVDLDFINQSISMESKTETPVALLPVALKIRDLLIDEIAAENIWAKNIWIITCEQDWEKLDELRRATNAEFHECVCSEQECLDRAMHDDERKNKDIQKQIIRRWFEKRIEMQGET